MTMNGAKITQQQTGTISVSGDLSGTFATNTVVKIHGRNVKAETPGSSQDGYVLTWVAANNQWELKPYVEPAQKTLPLILRPTVVSGSSDYTVQPNDNLIIYDTGATGTIIATRYHFFEDTYITQAQAASMDPTTVIGATGTSYGQGTATNLSAYHGPHPDGNEQLYRSGRLLFFINKNIGSNSIPVTITGAPTSYTEVTRYLPYGGILCGTGIFESSFIGSYRTTGAF